MSLLRKLKLGRVWYLVRHRPVEVWHNVQRQGGPAAYLALRNGQRRLRVAAAEVARPALPLTRTMRCNVLTGARFWDQTVACLVTLQRQIGACLPIRILDDGSLTREQAARLSALSPSVEIQFEAQAKERMADLLPAARFPTLHRLWREYKHIRKLTDAHLGRSDLNLVLDSDMLFHRRPEALINYLLAPSGALVMRDCMESYGYPRSVLEGLIDRPLPAEINVGLVAMNSGAINWQNVEHWAGELISRHGGSYFLEQALIALLLSEMDLTVLDRSDYRVIPEADPACERQAALVHYVHASKRQYFDRDWRALLKP